MEEERPRPPRQPNPLDYPGFGPFWAAMEQWWKDMIAYEDKYPDFREELEDDNDNSQRE